MRLASWRQVPVFQSKLSFKFVWKIQIAKSTCVYWEANLAATSKSGGKYVQEKKPTLHKINKQHSRKLTSSDIFVTKIFSLSCKCT